ncbi:MAG: AMP-binding protein [Myxococcales bacterium]|nr:AMP-binding protein [Myxococcales bacterium]
MNTLLDVLRACGMDPTSRGITFYPDDPEEGEHLPYHELPGRVGASMQALRRAGVRRGDRVIVPFETDRDMLVAFFALMGLGALPLSIKPEGAGGPLEGYLEFVRTVVSRYGVRYVLRAPSTTTLEGVGAQVLELPRPEQGIEPEFVEVGPDDLAFVQFSSGSTAFPKGIPVHHGRAVANMQHIVRLDGRRPEDPGASWLPLYHDMGLIGMLSSLVVGSPVHLHSPAQYLIDPIGWLHHLSRTRSFVFVTPNFGIDYALRRVREADPEDLEGLDLSALRWVYVGSEPINLVTLREFCDRLALYGLRREVFKPCYGMAEAVLVVSCEGDGQAARQRSFGSGSPMVGVGAVLPGFEIDIVDEDGRSLPPGEPGEILLRGGTLADGYFESDVPICAEGRFYATGDVGCLHEGHLYIAGRVGDRMKINGQSYFASAFEHTIESLPFVRPGRVSVIQPSDRVVVLAEIRDVRALLDRPRFRRMLGEHVFEQTGVKIRSEDVYFVCHGQLQKTSSGKLRRAAMAKALRNGELVETNVLRHALDHLRGYVTRLQYLRRSGSGILPPARSLRLGGLGLASARRR